MKTILKYLLLIIAFLFLSSGILVACFLDVYDVMDIRFFWLLLPMTLLFLSAVVVNDKILITKFLLKGKYGYYCISVFGIVYVLNLVFLYIEYATRLYLEIPMRISDYRSPWILCDILGNSLLLAMLLFGLGLLQLFNKWKAEVKVEKSLTRLLDSYISEVNKRLNLSIILKKLQTIADNVFNSPEATATRIRELSNYLREQLYELPEPPGIDMSEPQSTGHSHLAELLVSKKYSSLRHIIFISILVIISCGTFFNAPDNPEFTSDRFLSVFSLFGILMVLAYVNILWLYPKLLKQGNMKRYVISVSILLLLIVVPLITLQVLTYELNFYTKSLPVLIAIISTISSVLTLFLFVGGISSVLLLQNWVQTNHRMILLNAERVRQEYSWLRKQINPHFLFNVLNNIGSCAYDDPVLTSELLADLQNLLKYQLLDLRKETTTLKDECGFISSYFALESTRHDGFEYILECEAKEDVRIPTLLFIPFVENAVKYSLSDGGMTNVEVRFSTELSYLVFVCKNGYDKEKLKMMKHGGLGVENTVKRLKYLYDDNFEYKVSDERDTYLVTLKIPLI